MKKKDILKIISDAEKDIDKGVFTVKDEDSGIGIGNNQFRELASICRSAECYEEIELLIKYNRSKAAGEKGDRKSWNYMMKNGRSLSELIVDCMQRIKTESEKNGEDCLGNLTLFFGYMYWNARIWGAQSAERNNSGSYNNRGNGGSRFDNNRGGGQRNDRPDHRKNR